MNAKKILIIGAVILAIGVICLLVGGKKNVYVKPDNQSETETVDSVTGVDKSKTSLKFYLECSASMNGYMDHSGRFKDAINGCLSILNSSGYFDTIQLNYIGRNVHEFNSNFTLNQTESLLNEFLNPSYFQYNKENISHVKNSKNPKSGITYEDRNYSKLSEVLDTIIKRNREDVSVFVSDCILDPYDGQPKHYLALCKTDIYNLFQNALKNNPNLAVQIIQLNSKFVGSYYYKVQNSEMAKDGKNSNTETIALNGDVRPYYIWIIANRDRISKFNDKLNRLKEHNENSESINSAIFAPGKNISIEIKTNNPDGMLNMKDDFATFDVIADFSDLLIDDISWIKKKENYTFETRKAKDGDVIINGDIKYDDQTKKITMPIKLTNVRPNIRTTIKLKTRDEESVPQWVKDINGSDAKNDAKNIKTTGFKYLFEGVSEAYKDFNGNYITEFSIYTTDDSKGKTKKQRPIDSKKESKSKQSDKK